MLVVSSLSLTIVAALSAVALPLTQAAPTSAPLALVRRGARDDIACSFGLSGKQYFQKNGVFVGIYPNDEEKALVPLNTLAKTKFPLRGRTAQVENGTLWDAAQVLPILEDVKQAGAILELDLMIKTGWWGFTADNTQQAEQIAKQCAVFTAKTGNPVWLKFAVEADWYQSGEGGNIYGGTVDDFKLAWKVMVAALDTLSPSTKMWWAPGNAAAVADWEKYLPTEGRIDLVGFSYFADKLVNGAYVEKVKSFHDKFATQERPLAMGAIGLRAVAEVDDKNAFLREATKTDLVEKLPHYISASYFNFVSNSKDMRILYLDTEAASASGVDTRYLQSQVKNWDEGDP